MRHVFLELLELHPRLLDRLLDLLLRLLDLLPRLLDLLPRLLDGGLGTTLLDRIDDQKGEDEHEDKHKEHAVCQLKSSKLHR